MNKIKSKIEVVEEESDDIPIIPEHIEQMIERDLEIKTEEQICRSSLSINDKVRSLNKLNYINEKYKNIIHGPNKTGDIELYRNIKSIKTRLQSIIWIRTRRTKGDVNII